MCFDLTHLFPFLQFILLFPSLLFLPVSYDLYIFFEYLPSSFTTDLTCHARSKEIWT